MTARLHTELPDLKGHRAERAFIERLVELGDAQTEVWGNVDYLQGVGDLDTILLHRDIGIFTIEVKGVGLDAILDYGLKTCRIKDRSGPHPVDQVSLATLDLRHYLGRFPGPRSPFFIMTAAFPRIRRTAFAERFRDAQVVQHAESLIFEEDLDSSMALWRRLRHIREVPARGRGARNPVPTSEQISHFTDLVKPGPLPAVSQADQQRGGVLRRQITKPSNLSQKYIEPANRPPTIFRGAPGTGKTVRLQEIAVGHARAGRAVLFTCFNRVLASTLRGIMASQDLGEEVSRRIVVTHVDELRKQLTDDLDTFRSTFGTICVDEGQDLAQDAFEFLQALASPDAEWFMADGPGQELYGSANKTGEASAFLQAARADGTTEILRRNFRNSSAGYLVAQGVFEKSPDISAVAKWVSTHPLHRPAEDASEMLDLEGTQMTAGGELPQIIRVKAPPTGDWREAKLHAYVAVFNAVLEQLAAEGKRRDLAVLCARGDRTSGEPQLAREALAMLGVPVHDQIEGAARDAVVPEDHVRLTTIHSSRGIEASRVVILDYDRGVSSVEAHTRNSRIMCHIALSRGQLGTTVIALDDASSPHLLFLEELIRAYQPQED
ncbi:hypothetical protein HNR19_003125 [Nocardioides thalensis]|uniref:NERD domain-containing protein n=1 Tax=Nocardioides thalensis TaxID=1914755 RepID=A0A853C587_9ACTN|nr:NERD domain-containing protein [Nocardioides thalensis]NYJ02427.1 hypothetical protein [Nocardioides thalensis]